MDLELRGKSVLVTGASKGIGRSVAELMAAEGCDVHLAARSKDLLDELAVALPTQATVHAVDLAAPGAAAGLAAACRDVDILVNNAGAVPGGSIDAVDEAAVRAGYDLKLFGYMNLMREFYPVMKARGHGVIVNVIGTGGERPTADYAAGAVSNAGLMALTRALGGESGFHGVRVVAVNPGVTSTERLVSLGKRIAASKGLTPDEWEKALGTLPFDRPAKPEEVADLVAFLASARASYISGTVVTIDGGRVSSGSLG